jgi:1,2-phenylacetyl-CoA epoxidase catalytic subunit
LWPQVMQLFVALPDESLLVRAGYIPSVEQLQEIWCETVIAYLEQANLRLPQVITPTAENRAHHTPHLQELLQGLQEIARANPDAGW